MFPTPGTGFGAGYGGNAPGGASAGGAQREVRYKITVTADTAQANQQLQQLGQSAAQAASASQRAGQALQQMRQGGTAVPPSPWQMPAGQYHPLPYMSYQPPPQPGAAPRSGGDMFGGLMGMQQNLIAFGAALGSVTAVVQSFQGVLNSVTTLMSTRATAREKVLSGADVLPFGAGEALKGPANFALGLHEVYGSASTYQRRAFNSGRTAQIADALTVGRYDWVRSATGYVAPWLAGLIGAHQEYAAEKDWMADAPYRTELARIGAEGNASLRAFGLSSDADLMQARYRRDAGVSAAGLMFPGRTRFDTDDNYDAMIRRSVMGAEQQRHARVGAMYTANIADQEAYRLQVMTGRLADPYQQGFTALMALKGRAKTDPTVSDQLGPAAQRSGEQLVDYRRQLVQYQEQLNKAMAAGNALAQQEYELGKRQVGIYQAQLDVVNAKRQKLEGGMLGYAAMDPVSRENLRLGVREAQRSGFDGLPPELKSMLLGNGITGEFANKEALKAVRGDAGLAELMKLLNLEDMKTLDAQRLKLQGEVEVKLKFNEEVLLRQMEELMRKFGPLLEEGTKRLFKLENDAAEIKRIQGQQQKQ